MEVEYDIVFTSTMSENIEEAVRRGIAVSLLPASSITNDMDLMSGPFPDVPLTLKVGFAHGDMLDSDACDAMFSIISKGIQKAGFIKPAPHSP